MKNEQAVKEPRTVIHINRIQYVLSLESATGRALKELGSIPLTDVLFRKAPQEDEVIPNDAEVVLKDGDHFFSQPPGDYGDQGAPPASGPSAFLQGLKASEVLLQPDGWNYVLFRLPLPVGYQAAGGVAAQELELLVKLPPLFPDAAPDMFWVSPHLETEAGGAPLNTCTESLLGRAWQRFSWHLAPGAWSPGVSDLRDFMRFVRARFERRT